MKSFNEIYMKIYKENAEILEYYRKRARNRIIITTFVFLLLGIILSSITKNGIFLTVSLLIIFIYLVKSKSKKAYIEMFKTKIIDSLVKEYSKNLKFEHENGIDRITYLRAGFERFDKYESEDLIIGNLENGNHIKMAEVKTQRESRDKDGHKSTYTLFHGLFANIYLNKILNAHIKIRKNDISLFNGNDRIEMDSSKFEKKFNVYGNNKIITMQLLTADIMQMLLEFKEKNKITPEITINANQLYIRFETGEVFEGNLIRNSLDYSTLERYYRIINFTLDLAEKFSKNINDTEV